MNSGAIAQAALKGLFVLAALVVLFAVWRFLVQPLLRRRRRWQDDVAPQRPVEAAPQNPAPYAAYGNGRIDSAYQQATEAYATGRAELARLVETARRSEDEMRQLARSLQENNRKWSDDFKSIVAYKDEIDALLDQNFRSFTAELEQLRQEQSKQIQQLEARIEPLFSTDTCPWVVAMQDAYNLSEQEDTFLESIVRYIEVANVNLPKYLSGIEAAASQLGQFVFQVANQRPVDSSGDLLGEIAQWFSGLHQGHELKIPVVGDGFDDRIHKDVSDTPRDREAVSIVEQVVNWGLLEVGATPRTVFKAEVKCKK
jgi:molecular chaperone GrpE (heat shock protein)